MRVTAWMNLRKQYTKGKRPDTKGHMLCGSIPREYVQGQCMETESKLLGARAGEGEGGNRMLNGYRDFFCGDKMLWKQREVVAAQHCKLVNAAELYSLQQ